MTDPFARYRAALTHRSFTEEQGGIDNERLEFLGDAVLQLAVSELLVERFPNDDPGALTDRRKQLVQNRRLASISVELGLPSLARVGLGEQRTQGRNREKFQADLVEALLGAIYLDQGWEAARAVVRARWAPYVDSVQPGPTHPKVALQERVQARTNTVPSYRDLGHTGPPHAPTFEVAVDVLGEEVARGSGTSKKLAQNAAAEAALRTLRTRWSVDP